MSTKPQIIYDRNSPMFVVLPYTEYVAMTKTQASHKDEDENELIPFVISDYIKNPVRVLRVEAGIITQQELAKQLGVTQGYLSQVEARNAKVTESMLNRVKTAIAAIKHNQRTK